ncbi:uncharacterized protein LOC128955570 [Oppia nitens]|uniref:uncharacterized protein LOC128955570 n=1 Tax=Oppia nitens TaxID=1686743 RepID=UPI0023D9D316|nr:uncharacterized protein LOC128955570 [Oppia nitens]
MEIDLSIKKGDKRSRLRRRVKSFSAGSLRPSRAVHPDQSTSRQPTPEPQTSLSSRPTPSPQPTPDSYQEEQQQQVFTFSNNFESSTTDTGDPYHYLTANSMGNRHNRVSEVHQNSKEDKGLYLASDKVLDIIGYFNYSSIISHGLDDYFHGIIRGKLERTSTLSYDTLLTTFAWIIFIRNIGLAFIEDLEWRTLLGETERIRPERQLIMVCTIWSIYYTIVFKVYDSSTKSKYFTWLSPFQVLRGQSATKAYGLSTKMAEDWHKYTINKWRRYMLVTMIRALAGIGFILWVCTERWKFSSQFFNIMQVFWSALMILWMFITTNMLYVTYIYFNSLCYYFKIRYEKINYDIETIIVDASRMKSSDRSALLYHILVEHNELCIKIFDYNRFWAKWLMSTYFFMGAQLCFTLFQALFTTNPLLVRVLMFVLASESAYILTTISVNAAILSNAAHQSYTRLIRVTFDKYPVELQIQLRMFIQRLSGPTIGFYCLDLFEITYTTYASIVAALGQNFLLIVDFVRSYAEVGKEDDSLEYAFSQFTETVYNTTLTAMSLTGLTTESSIHTVVSATSLRRDNL